MTTEHDTDIKLQDLSESVQKIQSLQKDYDTYMFDIVQCQNELEKLRLSRGEYKPRLPDVWALNKNLMREISLSVSEPNTEDSVSIIKENRLQGRNEYCSKILQHLVPSFNDGMEKIILVFDYLKYDLEKWKVSQKIAQIGPRIEVLRCFMELDKLDERFEELEKQICNLIDVFESWLERGLRVEDKVELVSQLKVVKTTLTDQILAAIVAESIVIARQPPTFMVPSREHTGRSDFYMGRRHPCSPLLRILGGECIGFRTQQPEVSCKVIRNQVGTLIRNRSTFERLPSGIYQASFNKILLLHFKREKDLVYFCLTYHQFATTSGIFQTIPAPCHRYYLVFDVKVVGRYFRSSKSILSLPFAIYVNNVQRFDQGGDAFMWWQLAFCQGNGVLSESAPHSVPWKKAIEALGRKFQRLIEEPNEPYDVNTPPCPPPGLSDVARNHLSEKLNRNGFLTWQEFWTEKRCLKHDSKKGKDVPATFREWFYAAGLTINSLLRDYWNRGLITAFADKNVAKALVSEDPQQSKMLIWFPDERIGYIMFTYYLPTMEKEAKHVLLEIKLLENIKLDLQDVIQRDPILQNIKYIYPNYPISLLFKERSAVPQDEKSQKRWGNDVIEMKVGIIHAVPSSSSRVDEEETTVPFENNPDFVGETQMEWKWDGLEMGWDDNPIGWPYFVNPQIHDERSETARIERTSSSTVETGLNSLSKMSIDLIDKIHILKDKIYYHSSEGGVTGQFRKETVTNIFAHMEKVLTSGISLVEQDEDVLQETENPEQQIEIERAQKFINRVLNQSEEVESSENEVHLLTYILEVELKKAQRVTEPKLTVLVLKDLDSNKRFPDFKQTLIHSFTNNCLVAYIEEGSNEGHILKDAMADHWAYDKFPQFDLIIFADILKVNGDSIRELAFNAVRQQQQKLFDRLEKYLTEETLFLMTGRPRNVDEEEESPLAHVLLVVYNFSVESVVRCLALKNILLLSEKPLLPLSVLIIGDESGHKLISEVKYNLPVLKRVDET